MGRLITAPPSALLKNKVALEAWRDITEAYKSVGYDISLADVQAVVRLCRLYSLLDKNWLEIEGVSDPALFLELQKAVAANCRLIHQLETALFLNPVARMRGLPQKPAEKQVPDNIKGFEERL